MPTLMFKYIIIGDTDVGKSSLLLQFTEGVFQERREMTLGVEFGKRMIQIEDYDVGLEIWDTAGQESYLSITRSYYRNADGCILCFDLTRKNSFENMEMWLNEAKLHCNNKDLKIMMIGNKADLVEKRSVSKEEAQAFVDKHKLDGYVELSCRDFEEVQNMFIDSAKSIFKNIQVTGDQVLINGGSRLSRNVGADMLHHHQKSMNDCCNGGH